MQSQYPVVEAVLIGTSAIVGVLFWWILQAPRRLRKTLRRNTLVARTSFNGFQLGEAVRLANVFPQLRPKRGMHFDKHFDNLWIELRSRASLDFLLRVFDRQGFAIHAVGNHGVQSVRDRENSRAEGNFFGPQTAGIPGAVEIFLVRKHNLSGFPEEGNPLHHVVSDFAM